MDERAISFKDQMDQFRESQIEHGLDLAWKSNDAYGVYILHKSTLDHAFRWANSETIEVYAATAEKAHKTFERFVDAAGALIGPETDVTYEDL